MYTPFAFVWASRADLCERHISRIEDAFQRSYGRAATTRFHRSCAAVTASEDAYTHVNAHIVLGPIRQEGRSIFDRQSAAQHLLTTTMGTGDLRNFKGACGAVAFAPQLNQALVARDLLGQFPVFQSHSKDVLLLANETRLIAGSLHQAPELRPEILARWLTCDYAGGESLFRGIDILEKGTLLRFSDRRLVSQTRIHWDFETENTSIDRHVERLVDSIDQSVRDRLPLDGSIVGASLSGGMDSSTVVASIRQSLNADRVRPYSYRFHSLKDCDEHPMSQLTAEHLGLQPVWQDCESAPILDTPFEPFPSIPENPFDTWNAIYIRSLKQLHGDGGHVFLMGHGGDNMFTSVAQRGLVARARSMVRRFWQTRGTHLTDDYPWLTKKALDWQCETPILLPRSRHRDRSHVALITVQTDGVARASHWTNRVGYALGVTVDHPLFDRRVADAALRIPTPVLRSSKPKGLLRAAMAARLPSTLVRNPMKPSLVSYYNWGIRRQAKAIDALFKSNSMLADLGLIDPRQFQIHFQNTLLLDPAQAPTLCLFTVLSEIWLRTLHNEPLPAGFLIGHRR